VFRDRALALPPLNATLARRLMEQTRIYEALKGVRGRAPVDLALLEQFLVRFSQLVSEQPAIREIDVNPLLVSSRGILALDARVVLHGAELGEQQLPRPAIRPYPKQYISRWELANGTRVVIRPIRPEDERQIANLHRKLSERSVRLRYFQPLKLDQRTAHERLVRVCFNDYDRELALIVEHRNSANDPEILAVGRLTRIPRQMRAEFAIVVDDEWQRHGLGMELLRRLVQIGRDEGLSLISADILPDNVAMRRMCTNMGFRLKHEPGDPVVQARLVLNPPATANGDP
jgi:acetyltransferase